MQKKLKIAGNLVLFVMTALCFTACGEDEDPRLSAEDVACLKIIRAGGSCGGDTSSTATETITATTTTTDTATVTVTSTSATN